MNSVVLLLIVMFALPSPTVARGAILRAEGAWAAIDRGTVCEALSRSLRLAPKDRPQAQAGFAFSSDRRRWGEFHARLSRPPRPGSTIVLTVGEQPFLLIGRGEWAWSRGSQQQQAIIDAVRASRGMRLEGRDAGGTRFVDRYVLDGAPTAVDAAAAACAGKMQRR